MKVIVLLGLICLGFAALSVENDDGTYTLSAAGTTGSKTCQVAFVAAADDGEDETVTYTAGNADCEPIGILEDAEANLWIAFVIDNDDNILEAVESTDAFNQGLFEVQPTNGGESAVLARLDDDLLIDAGAFLYSEGGVDAEEALLYGTVSIDSVAVCNTTLVKIGATFQYKAPAEGDSSLSDYTGVGTTTTEAWIVVDVSDDSAWEITFSEEVAEDNEPTCTSEDGEDSSSGLLAIAQFAMVALGLLAL